MKAVAFVLFLLAAVSVGVVAAPVVQSQKSPTSGTMADPEVQNLVRRMLEKTQEAIAIANEAAAEAQQLEQENATLRAKLACS